MLPTTNKLSFGIVVQGAHKQAHPLMFVVLVSALYCMLPHKLYTEATCPGAGDTVCLTQHPIIKRVFLQ